MGYRTSVVGRVLDLDYSMEVLHHIKDMPTYRLVGLTTWIPHCSFLEHRIEEELLRRKISMFDELWYQYLEVFQQKCSPQIDRYIDCNCLYITPSYQTRPNERR